MKTIMQRQRRGPESLPWSLVENNIISSAALEIVAEIGHELQKPTASRNKLSGLRVALRIIARHAGVT